eukprot:m.867425 g.867425  ORF g.867425 m.867425 type:complete len:51 (-) comp23555_c0_seq4:201-353(-)
MLVNAIVDTQNYVGFFIHRLIVIDVLCTAQSCCLTLLYVSGSSQCLSVAN